MNNDKELLTLAAKAAGKELCIYDGMDVEPGTDLVVVDAKTGFKWNPLSDDGDALRLAVKLKLSIRFWSNDDVVVGYDDDIYECMSGEDKLAATRRAIVRAAAEIGRGME